MKKKYFLTLILQFIIFSISNAQTSVTVSGIIKASYETKNQCCSVQ